MQATNWEKEPGNHFGLSITMTANMKNSGPFERPRIFRSFKCDVVESCIESGNLNSPAKLDFLRSHKTRKIAHLQSLITTLEFDMTKLKPSNITTLTAKTVASIDAYEADQTEQARQDALESAIRLVRALETPGDAIYKLFASV